MIIKAQTISSKGRNHFGLFLSLGILAMDIRMQSWPHKSKTLLHKFY